MMKVFQAPRLPSVLPTQRCFQPDCHGLHEASEDRAPPTNDASIQKGRIPGTSLNFAVSTNLWQACSTDLEWVWRWSLPISLTQKVEATIVHCLLLCY